MNIEQLTDEQAYECFRLAFGRPVGEGRKCGINREHEKVEIYEYNSGGRLDLSMWTGDLICGTNWDRSIHGHQSVPINARAVMDYLDSLTQSDKLTKNQIWNLHEALTHFVENMDKTINAETDEDSLAVLRPIQQLAEQLNSEMEVIL